LNSMLGYTMWDYETGAPLMWPKKQRYPTDTEMRLALERNPEGAVVRGKWADPNFSADVNELNPKITDTQFGDYHGHGWNFRAIFKRDRKGNLLDDANNIIPASDPEKFKKAVHLDSIHVDFGMQCVDCHFSQDAHGSGHIYGEVQAAIEITCADCHGTATKLPDLRTHGPAAPPNGTDLSTLRTADGRARFEWRGDKLFQRSAVYPGLEWEMTLVKDTVTLIRPTRWPATPAICHGPRAALAAICRSRPISIPSDIITKARPRAISRPTTLRSRARRCFSLAATAR